jgi:hypothetical protein
MQASTREVSGQNDGFTVAKFTERFPVAREARLPWQIAFIGWCYLDALRRHRNDGAATLPFTDTLSYQALYADFKKKGWLVQPFDPAQARPGDILFFPGNEAGTRGYAELYYGMVNGKVCSVGGNVRNSVTGTCRDPNAAGRPLVALGAIPAATLD